MKNKFGLITLAILSTSLTACGSWYDTYKDADKYLVGDQTYQQEINVLDIDWVSGSVTLIEDSSIQGVKVEEVTTLTSEKEQVHSYLNDGELKIKFFASGYHRSGFSSFKKDLTVTYKPGLSKINIDLTSGSLKADSITTNSFNLDVTSGKSSIGLLTSESTNIDLTSGDVEIGTVVGKDLDVDATSGSIDIGFNYIEKASFDMTSGDIKMTLPLDGGKVKVSKTSGSVTTYRDCTINGNTYTFGTGIADINVSMTSGKVKIY